MALVAWDHKTVKAHPSRWGAAMRENEREGPAMEDSRAVREGSLRKGLVKVLFRLEQDADGHPPVAVESLWARAVEGGYQLDNIPFFARLVSSGDVVAADQEADGALVFRSVIRSSGHSTVRVYAHDAGEATTIRADLQALGCASEGSGMPGLFAVDVPAEVDYRLVRQYLKDGATRGRWDYEEAALADHVPEE